MTAAGSDITSDRHVWPPELTRACSELVVACNPLQSCKKWVAFRRAVWRWWLQLKLLSRTGLESGCGLVAGQCPAPVEMRKLAGQMSSVIAIFALELGLTIELCTHVLYSNADLSKYLERYPRRLAQVTSLRLNYRGTASEAICVAAEQGNHSKTLTVHFPSPKVAALLGEKAPREQVQNAARASPGLVLVQACGSDNFGPLSGIKTNRENLDAMLARPGMEVKAQLPLLAWHEKLADPPLPTAPICPTRAAAQLTGRDLSMLSGLARTVDGVTLALSRNNSTGYLGVQALPSGKFWWKVLKEDESKREVVAQGVCDTAVEAARDRALSLQ